ncbi:MAG TPA: dTDP-4-dehydrorhamnose reductase [Blastocatellia bacterium]|nr:dTDP-4-dehydrorhamnose reductase [Blastocatellia bacterium]
MVGRAVSDHCRSIGDEVFSCDHQSLDIADPDLVLTTLRQDRPEAVINCAAWTDVDGCELDPERAFAANARGPENLALASRQLNARFVTISTDYVFSGEKEGFYTQRDQADPQSIYGVSKLEGERRAQSAYSRTIIVRTGFIFGPGGNNFLSTIVERARHGDKLKGIADAYGTPTYSRDLAVRLRELAQLDLPGTFHVVNAGDGVSYEVFARAALDLGGYSSTSIESVLASSLHRPAPRPRNSRLRCLLSGPIGLSPLPFWKDSVGDFVALNARSELAAKS